MFVGPFTITNERGGSPAPSHPQERYEPERKNATVSTDDGHGSCGRGGSWPDVSFHGGIKRAERSSYRYYSSDTWLTLRQTHVAQTDTPPPLGRPPSQSPPGTCPLRMWMTPIKSQCTNTTLTRVAPPRIEVWEMRQPRDVLQRANNQDPTDHRSRILQTRREKPHAWHGKEWLQMDNGSQTTPHNGGWDHGLRTPREEIAFTARPKIQSQSQIFRYGRSIFCLPHRPNFSDIFIGCP